MQANLPFSQNRFASGLSPLNENAAIRIKVKKED